MNVKTMLALVFAVASATAFATPPVPPVTSESVVSGSVTQNGAAIIQVAPSFGNFAQANGSQSGAAAFGVDAVSPAGESVSGSAVLNGSVAVDSTVKDHTSTASGTARNDGTVTTSGVLDGAGTLTTQKTLSGTGSMQTATGAVIGTLNADSQLVNGASANTTTLGSFSYSVSDPSNAFTGWTGNGSSVGSGTSTVAKTGSGYSSSTTAAITVVACPVKP